jgi:hypothetical protein
LKEREETRRILRDTARYLGSGNETEILGKLMGKTSLIAYFISTDRFYYYARLSYTDEKICHCSRIRFGASRGIIAMFLAKGSPYKEFLGAK